MNRFAAIVVVLMVLAAGIYFYSPLFLFRLILFHGIHGNYWQFRL